MAAPITPVNAVSKLRERTDSTPSVFESQVQRTIDSHSKAMPSTNVARRQCSVNANTVEIPIDITNSAIIAHCARCGSFDGDKFRS